MVLLISLNCYMSTLRIVHYALLQTLSRPSNCVTSANTVCRGGPRTEPGRPGRGHNPLMLVPRSRAGGIRTGSKVYAGLYIVTVRQMCVCDLVNICPSVQWVECIIASCSVLTVAVRWNVTSDCARYIDCFCFVFYLTAVAAVRVVSRTVIQLFTCDLVSVFSSAVKDVCVCVCVCVCSAWPGSVYFYV